MNDCFLFDTNIIIDYLRGNKLHGDLLNSKNIPNVSFITVGELYNGLRDKREQNQLKSSLKKFSILMINDNICKNALDLLDKYKLSHNLLLLDAAIAATALQKNLTIVTQNIKHFQMIKGLKIQKFDKRSTGLI